MRHLHLKGPEIKINEFANSVDPDEEVHYELPDESFLFYFADVNFALCLFSAVRVYKVSHRSGFNVTGICVYVA